MKKVQHEKSVTQQSTAQKQQRMKSMKHVKSKTLKFNTEKLEK